MVTLFTPTNPKRLQYTLSCSLGVKGALILIHLMQPQIVSEILPYPPLLPLLPLVPPASFFPEFLGLIADQLSLPTNEVALDLSEFLGFFHANDFVSKLERI